MVEKKVNIAVVGLNFGAQFAPIYQLHPDVEVVGICDTNEDLLNEYGDKFGFKERYTSLDQVLNSGKYDAVHLLTPIHSHARPTLDVLNAGLHCACAVPMATALEELEAIVEAQKISGKNYMMMETAIYTYQYLHAKEMKSKGEFGQIQFLRGAHYQDMENWPDYWMGLPPMHYATHAIAPLLAISEARAIKVHCFGSGSMREELQQQYNNPYPIETAIFQLDKENLCAEVTRSLFNTARDYMESFNVYGENSSLEWHIEQEPLHLFQMGPLPQEGWRKIQHKEVRAVARPELLPTEISKYMEHHDHLEENNPHISVLQGEAHHGSHPHLVHEFIRSIVEKRKPFVDAVTAANWTAAGICAHESAMNGGVGVDIPVFEGSPLTK
ncbi:Gfo/Idh/MocA family oxidoreductase [Bacillus sp. FJAT-49711]|uniref:Gfo/Idh/MocA family protein n=1 Tax=Bacillus sp. FJAT-49711 TaxID=2833585 RepID=UPI001BCA0DCF|nr:Gfo/Idh/MocA family oxidoreductase [Bacillus sp. FJAT-49711]MBS4219058.1 Gfo/Idh/MocA family oxidoreductase [Bacillus sp. FJAT-49711]